MVSTEKRQPGSFDEEIDLVRRAGEGDANAFGELYLQYLDPMFRYIYFRVGNRAEAEDLTEQLFLRAWEAVPGYREQGHPFSSWLYRIAGNLITDYRRRARQTPALELVEEMVSPEEQETPPGRVIRAEQIASLALAIGKLTGEQQQVVILRFIEGLSHAEVARILNKSEGACRAIQHRALATLARQIATEGR